MLICVRSFLYQDSNHMFYFCHSQKQQCIQVILDFSTPFQGHALFGRERVTARDKPLQSCVSLCQHGAVGLQVFCVLTQLMFAPFYLLLFLLEEIREKIGLIPQMETVYLFSW